MSEVRYMDCANCGVPFPYVVVVTFVCSSCLDSLCDALNRIGG